MALKFVTFEIAKVLKEAGYPQNLENTAYYNEEGMLVKPYVFCGGKEIADAPTYIDAWLWMWREKKIAIGCPYENTYNYWFTNINAENDKSLILWKYSSGEREDPEEAIISAIEYLVENNLIK